MWTVCAQLDGSKSSLLQSTGSSPYVLVHIVGPPAATVLNIFFLWWKESIRCFDRHCWNAACCSRMSEVRDYRCSWLAVKWCSAFPLILWLYVWFLDLLFFIVKFSYFQVFHTLHIFTSNWYSQLFQISVFANTLRVFTTPNVGQKTLKGRKVYSCRLRQSDWSAMTH